MAEGKDKFDINNDQKLKQDNLDKSDGPGPDGVSGDVVNMADMHFQMDDAAEHQAPKGPPQDPQGMGLDRLGTQFDEDGMADMHSHMDDAAEHQVPKGPPQDPQGMGLDRLGTQFDEDGMGDMHTPDDPNDGGEVV